VSHFMPRLSWTLSLLFVLPSIAGMTCMPPCPASEWDEVSWTSCLA
jgi:hypothetical protein